MNVLAGIEISDMTLPYSLDAEQAVLGSVLQDSSLMNVVSDKLHSDYFNIQLHKDIFAVFSQMFVSGDKIDIITVIESTLRQGIFQNQDEAKSYLVRLAESAISPSSIETYAGIIEDKYLVRQLMFASKEIFDQASAGASTTQELLDFAEKRIFDIRSDREVSGLRQISSTVALKLDELAELAKNPNSGSVTGLRSSFPRLDSIIYGLNKSDMLVIAARPGMGKTSFAMNIVTGVAKYYKDKKIAIFSLEMSREQLVGRMLSSEARISSDQMRSGELSKEDWKNVGGASDVLMHLPIYIDDKANISIVEMKAKLRRLKNLGLVVIDYLQLMSSPRRDGNRVNEISDITRNVKIMAKELDVPVIILSQLSRAVDARTDKRPLLSDLRESGSIEQDADIVMFLYREGAYDKQSEDQSSAECIVAKNRHGRTDTIGMNWDGQYTKFTDVDYVHAE